MMASKRNKGKNGRLIVLEGPDGVGKSTTAQVLAQKLRQDGTAVEVMTFPGREAGTLGSHVYAIHHDSRQFGICSLAPPSRQLLHIAAHVDTILHRILPTLRRGVTIILDRFWWSTWVYGRVDNVPANILDAMIGVEQEVWGEVVPRLCVLLRRTAPIDRDLDGRQWQGLQEHYLEIARREGPDEVLVLENTESAESAASSIEEALRDPEVEDEPVQPSLFYEPHAADTISGLTVLALSHLAPLKATEVYNTYWRFAAERQEIFFRRLERLAPPWTEDPILATYKFTNVYRASDRVSQFLIREVIYNPKYPSTPEELFFRILLFKLFNKIETWQRLEKAIGALSFAEYSFERYDEVLTNAMAEKQTIYSAAYIMPSGGHLLGSSVKHRNHLRLLEHMMADEAPKKITDATSMHRGFDILLGYPMIGDFLAYQFIIDLNYSQLTNFSENDFVVPGPGALNGIRKCFADLGGLNEPEVIRFVTDQQQTEFERLGLGFRSLWGRPLQLIDCQNLFCEVDKYSRVRHPEVVGVAGRSRIKQRFSENRSPIEYWYPPKWGINEMIASQSEKRDSGVAREGA